MPVQRRVVDFVRVGYFIPLNGPLHGHPPSSSKDMESNESNFFLHFVSRFQRQTNCVLCICQFSRVGPGRACEKSPGDANVTSLSTEQTRAQQRAFVVRWRIVVGGRVAGQGDKRIHHIVASYADTHGHMLILRHVLSV